MAQRSHASTKSPQHWAHRLTIICLLLAGLLLQSIPALGFHPLINRLNQFDVPILGVTLDQDHQTVGIITHIVIYFEKRMDDDGLKLRFRTDPGRFSPYAQQAVSQAITRAGQAAHLRTDSWTIYLTFPYPGLTMYGDSLSAMVGLSVVAMAKGDPIIFGQSLTGTITEDGHIGVVGGVPYKVDAAYSEHMERVLIPEEQHIGDRDLRIPFMMHVSPVGTVDKAYYALTGHSLH